VDLRRECKRSFPDWHNAPVDAFGDLSARYLIVGLAPGLRGANRTGRPFTGDAAGGYLFLMLRQFNLASGSYSDDANDDLRLQDTRITNAVRCLPPENKPTSGEVNNCRDFLRREINAMPNLQTILALGKLAHDAVLRCFELPLKPYPFAHASLYDIAARDRNLTLLSSYHCSRYNTQTGRLTEPMFAEIFEKLQKL
jgi:uracil-DNA glycosylase family 4